MVSIGQDYVRSVGNRTLVRNPSTGLDAPHSRSPQVVSVLGRVRYSGLKEAAFVRGERYGISIDFGLEAVGRQSTHGAAVNLELISFP